MGRAADNSSVALQRLGERREPGHVDVVDLDLHEADAGHFLQVDPLARRLQEGGQRHGGATMPADDAEELVEPSRDSFSGSFGVSTQCATKVKSAAMRADDRSGPAVVSAREANVSGRLAREMEMSRIHDGGVNRDDDGGYGIERVDKPRFFWSDGFLQELFQRAVVQAMLVRRRASAPMSRPGGACIGDDDQELVFRERA